jgi:pilus assembly protein CpaE
MSDKIRVLIVDDLPTTRESVRKLLQFEAGVELVAEASTGLEAIAMAEAHKPDVILMDINMPDMDGITASQEISKTLPRTQILMMSVQSETDYMRRAMLAGARDFLTKPFSLDELLTAIREAYDRYQTMPEAIAPALTQLTEDEHVADWFPTSAAPAPARGARIVVVYSPKGGSGCSMLAVNTAVGLARGQHKTLIMDGSLQFGDVGLLLNLKSPASIIDLVQRIDDLDNDLINGLLAAHSSGVKALLAPPAPEMAEMVQPEHLRLLLNALRPLFEFIIIDTPAKLDDMTLTLMDAADEIWLVTTPNLAGIKNASRFFDLAQALEYELDKVKLVVNGVAAGQGIAVNDIGRALKRPVIHSIPRDITAVELAVNQGQPVLQSGGKGRPIAQALQHLVTTLATEEVASNGQAGRQTGKPSFWRRLFGRR